MSSIDIGSSRIAASLQADGSVAGAVGVNMLRKSMELEAQSVTQLLQSVPQVPSSNPPHLGNFVDTHA